MDFDARPLSYIFLDLNSYFASVEQAENPALRGKAMAVAPTPGDGATIIAASYEAKRFGVKTGTKVGDARTMCPQIEIVDARPSLYTHYHNQILEAVDHILPVEKVCSVDEMRFRLLGDEMNPARAVELAQALKDVIRSRVSPVLTSSVGIAPNAFLAKLATEFEKPDGLVVIEARDLPGRLDGHPLTIFPGINRKMEARLMATGIFKSDQLVRANQQEIRRAFGSITGEKWWFLLRGFDVNTDHEVNKSLGHSNVLGPEWRSDAGAREILLRLTNKAAARLRANGLWATHLSVHVTGVRRHWHRETKLPPTQDAITVAERLLELWETRDFDAPRKVGVTFTGLRPISAVTPSLFDQTAERAQLGHAIDSMNQRYGKNTVYLAGLTRAKDQASEKIAFNKTWLFSEGKDDNVWPGKKDEE